MANKDSRIERECGTCNHFYGNRFGGSGCCKRYPEDVGVDCHHVCGEWQSVCERELRRETPERRACRNCRDFKACADTSDIPCLKHRFNSCSQPMGNTVEERANHYVSILHTLPRTELSAFLHAERARVLREAASHGFHSATQDPWVFVLNSLANEEDKRAEF